MSDLAVDACCLLNLIAAGNILPRIGDTPSEQAGLLLEAVLHVPATVANEALYVLHPDEDDADKLVKCELDIDRLIEAGVLHGCDLQSGDESELFIQLAVRLDDGEAACLAIAKSRSWVLATDDRVARKLAYELEVLTVGTAELVKRWAELSAAGDDLIAQTITNIQRFAKFSPRAGSPDADWWNEHLPN